MAEESKTRNVCRHCDAKYEDHSAYQARCFTGYGVGIRGLRDTSFEPVTEPAPDPQEPLCADCEHELNDSRFHFEAPGTNWGAALHNFKPRKDGNQ